MYVCSLLNFFRNPYLPDLNTAFVKYRTRCNELILKGCHNKKIKTRNFRQQLDTFLQCQIEYCYFHRIPCLNNNLCQKNIFNAIFYVIFNSRNYHFQNDFNDLTMYDIITHSGAKMMRDELCHY